MKPPQEPDFDSMCATQAATEALQDFVRLMYDADGTLSAFGLMQPGRVQVCARAAWSALFQLGALP